VVENALKDVVESFSLQDLLPWSVLAHIDVQAEVGRRYPGSVATTFQSLAGTDECNKIFDITIEKILVQARAKKGLRYGLYFETGQGSEFTNGAAHGLDMVVLESRKYGFCRAVQNELAQVQPRGAWLHVNDVAGFIGPEVFRTREQLVRCCLEDLAMGKLHGLNIGLDICSTLHMSVSLDDLEWCQEQLMPACPSYLMALPTRNDPMLSYLSTSFQDHVRLREKFGLKVNDGMWAFYQRIGIVDRNNRYTAHYGDPVWVYYQYRLAKGDQRCQEEIYAEGKLKVTEVEARGVDIAVGHGEQLWDLEPCAAARVTSCYEDAKISLRAEFSATFIATVPHPLLLRTTSRDRDDYILHPERGEKLTPHAVATLEQLRESGNSRGATVQIVISDGLNAKALMDEGHLDPYLQEIRKLLTQEGVIVNEINFVVISGRVRAGYEIGCVLFEKSAPHQLRAILHLIGERPGTMHHSYSAYITVAKGEEWARKRIDHDITKVVSNIADTALPPVEAARESLVIIREMIAKLTDKIYLSY
jgi:ethanolamine ammonia-lyase large subunit